MAGSCKDRCFQVSRDDTSRSGDSGDGDKADTEPQGLTYPSAGVAAVPGHPEALKPGSLAEMLRHSPAPSSPTSAQPMAGPLLSLPTSPLSPLNRNADRSCVGAPWSLPLPYVLIPCLKQTLAQRLSKFIHCAPRRQCLGLAWGGTGSLGFKERGSCGSGGLLG